MKNKLYTTPIFYANAAPHIGHAYASVIADFYGLFQTGTDEHGLKIEKVARSQGLTPKELVDRNHILFQELWSNLQCRPKNIIRTTDQKHKDTVISYWNKCLENGDIFKGKYTGLYCVGCEAFLTDKDLVDNLCPYHKTRPESLEEETYFFNLKKYQSILLSIYQENEGLIHPKNKLNEILTLLQDDKIQNLSISRKNLDWGIKVPNDPNQTIYVWFDALFNYIVNLENADLSSLVHVIGKDIIKFHSFYWPAFLLSAGFKKEELPSILVHGFITQHNELTKSDDKISKSVEATNIYKLDDLIEKFGSDAIRYYLLRNCEFDKDFQLSLNVLKNQYNSELVGKIGNLAQRTIGIANKLNGGILPPIQNINVEYDLSSPRNALEQIILLAQEANKFFDEQKPWALNGDSLNSFLSEITGRIYSLLPTLERVVPKITRNISQKLAFDNKDKERKISKLEEPLIKKIEE